MQDWGFEVATIIKVGIANITIKPTAWTQM
jgi:hypothetical protein